MNIRIYSLFSRDEYFVKNYIFIRFSIKNENKDKFLL